MSTNTQQRDDVLAATIIAELRKDLDRLTNADVQETVEATINLWAEICDRGVTIRHISDWRHILRNGGHDVERDLRQALLAYHNYECRGNGKSKRLLGHKADKLGLYGHGPREDARIAARIHYAIHEVDSLVMSKATEHLLPIPSRADDSEHPASVSRAMTDTEITEFADKVNVAYQQVTKDNPDVSQVRQQKLLKSAYSPIKEEVQNMGLDLDDWRSVMHRARKIRHHRQYGKEPCETQEELSQDGVTHLRALLNGTKPSQMGNVGVALHEALSHHATVVAERAEDAPNDSCDQQEQDGADDHIRNPDDEMNNVCD